MDPLEHGVEGHAVTITEPILLPADVVLVPVEELPVETREQLEHNPGDYALTRPQTRTTSSIVDRSTAGLLERFRAPTRIVDAVVDYSRSEGLDAGDTLERAFPMLAGFLNTGMLVPADSQLADPIDATIESGSRLAGLTVLEPVHVIDDTEVHLARAADGTYAALKVARASAVRDLRRAFDHEAAILAALSGKVSPRLLGRGSAEGREYLAVEWCAGTDVLEASAELRDTRRAGELLDLGERVLAAYAHLHREGFLHGDVHPRNVLVEADGRVRLIDFGLAAPVEATSGVPRGGIDLFLEPELARARLAGLPPPALSAAGEQYSVGALLYLLLTGGHTHVFSLDEERMLRQLLADPPLPFRAHGAGGLGGVERVVGRALAKDPGDRHESLESFRDDYRKASSTASGPGRRRSAREAEILCDEVLGRLAGPLAEGELEPPTASVNLGAAGLAYGALRIGVAREDASLLALAERWAARAALAAAAPAGFENPELEITPEQYGRASLYHSAVGVHCVGALVARARGDELVQTLAIEQLAASVREPQPELDVAFGLAGAIVGCALVLEAVPHAEPLALAGDELAGSLRARLGLLPAIADAGDGAPLGTAHGWAGYLYALLRWSEARGLPAPSEAEERLDQLAGLAVPLGRGLRWPREVGLPAGENALAASWCNGAAGQVHLWLAADRLLGGPGFARLAEGAAWTAYDAPDAGGDLCCGPAGRAYALLAVHRQLGGDAWLDRGVALAERAARGVRRDALRRDSLYKGEVGVAVLAAELARPEWAAMPLFEREGWTPAP